MAGKTDIIFCGNPGVGKSSIATSISGIQFKSGVSFGSGLTVELTWNEAPALPNVRFADTPGLADIFLKEQAAEAITAALAQGAAKGHNTKIIFVVTTEEGRLRTEDMYTIKVVMNSIKLANGATPGANSYAIIINKCTFLDNPSFLQAGRARLESMLSDSKTNPIPSAYVRYLPAMPEIAGKDNARISFDGLLDWVLGMAPSIQVVQAESIDTNSQEEVIAAMKEEHAAALDQLERLSVEQARELAAASQARREMEARMKEQLAYMERRARYAEEQRRKEAEEARKEMARLEAQRRAEMKRLERERKEQQRALERAAEQERRERQLADEARRKEIARMEAQRKADKERRQEIARLEAQRRADKERRQEIARLEAQRRADEERRQREIRQRQREEQARRAAIDRQRAEQASRSAIGVDGLRAEAGVSSSGASVGAQLGAVSAGGVTARAGLKYGADEDGLHLGPVSFKFW